MQSWDYAKCVTKMKRERKLVRRAGVRREKINKNERKTKMKKRKKIDEKGMKVSDKRKENRN